MIQTNIIRGVVILLLQILIFSRVDWDSGVLSHMHIIVSPIIILLLPIRWTKPLVIFIAFILGLILDVFYDTPGLHAGAGVMMAYFRGILFRILEPFEGYGVDDAPTIEKHGLQWFLIYMSSALFVYMLAFFSLEYFSHLYIVDILMNTIFSFIGSFITIMLYMLLFSPKS